MVVKKTFLPLFLMLFLVIQQSGADELYFKYVTDTKYRIVSQASQAVYVNGKFYSKADILNKIAVHIIEGSGKEGTIDALYQMSERQYGEETVYQWAKDLKGVFTRSSQGLYRVPEGALIPHVRDIPTFPARDLKPGDKWEGYGLEIHNLADSFGIDSVLKIPVQVSYQYVGKDELDGKEYDLIKINYMISFNPDRKLEFGDLYPEQVTGSFDQMMYWDQRNGRPYSYNESFRIAYLFYTGETILVEGVADGQVFGADIMDKAQLEEDLKQELEEQGIEGAEVSIEDNGVSISMDNIQFLPDSSTLLDTEKVKLEKIGEILKKYSDKDIMIVGHAARIGAESYLRQLSENRARSVGNFFLHDGIRMESEMIIKGMGSAEPVASNSTEEGRRKNRRVEIIILEN